MKGFMRRERLFGCFLHPKYVLVSEILDFGLQLPAPIRLISHYIGVLCTPNSWVEMFCDWLGSRKGISLSHWHSGVCQTLIVVQQEKWTFSLHGSLNGFTRKLWFSGQADDDDLYEDYEYTLGSFMEEHFHWRFSIKICSYLFSFYFSAFLLLYILFR